MSAFLPSSARGATPERDFPRLQQRPFSPAEQRARWEVRAAEWRAREIAELVFGRVSDTALSGLRPRGALRGLLRMDVPFESVEDHSAREHRFMEAVSLDPILSRISLVYIFGPEGG